MIPRGALTTGSESDTTELQAVLQEVHARFSDGATTPAELAALGELEALLRNDVDPWELDRRIRALVHDGYLRGTLSVLADALSQIPRPDLGVVLARELLDALDRPLGTRLLRAILADLEPEHDTAGPYARANLLLGDALLAGGDAPGALRHFEALLAMDVDHPRALRGWSDAVRHMERRGIPLEHRSRGLAMLEGLEEVDLGGAGGLERYEIGRPLGRGRHAVVYQAHDRHVGRDVAIKRLLDVRPRRGGTPARVIEARFFREAETLRRVRSPYVVALYDAQPRHRFIAMELCRGGNLLRALRRGLAGPEDLPRIGRQLRAALEAVHAVGAVHRDVKPANLLVREPKAGSAIALADFGLAVETAGITSHAGTLRYLAPELRLGPAGAATPASDFFSAGVVLLELARSPHRLPDEFDALDSKLDPAVWVPEDLAPPWPVTLRSLLSRDPEARSW